MNDFADSSDWEKLVALSDDELEAAIAKQKDQAPPLKTQVEDQIAQAIKNDAPPAFYEETTLTSEQSDEFNFAEVGLNWDDLLESESKPIAEVFEYPNWEETIIPNIKPPVEEVIPDWEKLNDGKNHDLTTESWQIASDDVNTEFMKEWEQSAAKISELTGIDLSKDLDLSGSQGNEKVKDVIAAPAKPKERKLGNDLGKMLPPTSSDESGPLPPLPVLPPKKAQPKKQPIISKPETDWYEKYHDKSPESVPTSKPSKPTYDFDQLAEEICENDQFSWTNLNQSAQNQPNAPKGRNPSDQIVIDLEDAQVESTAVWNYNPPESYTEIGGEISAFKPKPNFDLLPALTQIWQNFKIPIIAIAALGGLFAIYSVPFVQRAVTEAGLKSQLLKDASRKDLAGSNFQDSKLERTNFSNANLKNVNFKRANLNGVNFEGANLKGANFSGANLRATRLKDSKIELKGDQLTKLEPKDLLMWRIVNQPLAGRNLSRQNLEGFYLGSAMLKKANLTEAKLTWVNFVNADLSEAQLTRANLTGVNFVGANLTGADLNGVTWIKHKPKTNDSTTCPNRKKGPCQF